MSNKKVTKKSVKEALKEVKTVEECKSILRSINDQIADNNKVIARNMRLKNEIKDDKEFLSDLDQISQVKTNWNVGLEMVKDEVFDKWDKLL